MVIFDLILFLSSSSFLLFGLFEEDCSELPPGPWDDACLPDVEKL